MLGVPCALLQGSSNFHVGELTSFIEVHINQHQKSSYNGSTGSVDALREMYRFFFNTKLLFLNDPFLSSSENKKLFQTFSYIKIQVKSRTLKQLDQ